MLFSKKSKRSDDTLKDNKKTIDYNAALIDVLIVMVDDESIKAKFEEIKHNMLYLETSYNDKVIQADKKIGDMIGDIKVAINKAQKTNDYAETNSLINKLEQLIAERNAYLKK